MFLLVVFLGIITLFKNYQDSNDCKNRVINRENNFEFCLPDNYIEVPKDSKDDFALQSFMPKERFYECIIQKNSYCNLSYFNYAIGNATNPSASSFGAMGYDLAETAPSQLLNKYSYYTPCCSSLLYSYKLKNGKYAYFYFNYSHPKFSDSERTVHMKIIQTVRVN